MITDSCTTIDLLRHGEVEGGSCYRGSQDDPLTKAGWQQMLRATEHQRWDVIISSPLGRCAEFAKFLSAQCNIHDNLREINFGDWEGKTYDQLKLEQATAFTGFLNDPENNTPPNAEPLLNFRRRVIREWNKITVAHQGNQVLIIAHGGTIRTIISHVLGMPAKNLMRLDVALGSLSRIQLCYYKNEISPCLLFHGKTVDE